MTTEYKIIHTADNSKAINIGYKESSDTPILEVFGIVKDRLESILYDDHLKTIMLIKQDHKIGIIEDAAKYLPKLECEDCGLISTTVKCEPCPYEENCNGRTDIKAILCPKCSDARWQEV